LISTLENDPISYKVAVIENLFVDNAPLYLTATTSENKLAVIKQVNGMGTLVRLVSLMLTNFVKSFNVATQMTFEQITDTAMSLISTYSVGSADNPSFSLEDFSLFFELAKRGRYGKVYKGLDMSIIFEWISLYENDRYNALIEEHERLKNAQETPISSEDDRRMAENFDKVIKLFKEKIKEVKEKEIDNEEEEERRKQIINNKRKLFWNE